MKTIRLMLAVLIVGISLPVMAMSGDTIVLDNVTYVRVRAGDYKVRIGLTGNYFYAERLIFDSIAYQANGHKYKDYSSVDQTVLKYDYTRFNDDDTVVVATINTNSLHLLKTPEELIQEYGYGYAPTAEQFEDTRSDELMNVRVRHEVEFDGVPYPVVSVSHDYRYYGTGRDVPGARHAYYPYTSYKNTIIDGDGFSKITFDNGCKKRAVLPFGTMFSYHYPLPVTVPLPKVEPSIRVWPVDTLIFSDDVYLFNRSSLPSNTPYYPYMQPYEDEYGFLKYPKHLIKYLRLGRYFIDKLDDIVIDGLLLDDIDLPESPYLNYKKRGNTIYSLDGKCLAFHKRSSTEELEVDEGVTHIGPSALMNTSFTSVKLPKSLKVIGDSAFFSSSLEEVGIYADSIYAFAFANSKNLRKVSLYTNPMIFAEAFWDCPNLKEVYCYTIDPPVLCYQYDNHQRTPNLFGVSNTEGLRDSRGTFGGCGNDITIYVPKYCSERYETVKYHLRYKGHNISNYDQYWLCWGDKTMNNSIKIVEMEDYVAEGIEGVGADSRSPSVTLRGREVSISGASGSVMAEAFDSLGRRVYAGRGTTFTLPGSGVYILRINGSAQKIMVK